MRPEFLNRVDEIIVFHPLGIEEIRKIVEILFSAIQHLAKDNHDMTLGLTGEAMDWLADQGFDPMFGARPLKRVIQREIANRLAEAILSDQVHDDDVIEIDVNEAGDGLVFIPAVTPERAQPLP